jgi:spermidine dehydrogenase
VSGVESCYRELSSKFSPGAREFSKQEGGGMSEEGKKRAGDSALGMDQSISRRDFMNATLVASGGALLGGLTPMQLMAQMGKDNWTGYGGVGDYAESHGNTFDVMTAGHQIRDHVFANPAAQADDTGEVFDFVVVGGGLSGLASALYVRQHAPKATCLVLENHPIFGGEAKRNEFEVDGETVIAPQGSDHFATPHPGTPIADFYESIGVDAAKFEYQAWKGSSPEIPVGRSFEHIRPPYGIYFGASFGGQSNGMWVVDPWGRKLEGAPMSASMRAEILKYRELGAKPGPENPHELDAMTMEAYMMQKFGLSQEAIRKFLMPGPGDGYGIGPDALSAYAYGFAGDPMNYGDDTQLQSFAGGNGGFARHMVKTLLPASISGPRTLEAVSRGRVNFAALDQAGEASRIRLGSTVVRVEHEGAPEKSEFVRITYTREGKVYRLKARAVVMAGGSWTTKHIVIDLPAQQREAYAQFLRSPCMLVSVALRNWRFLYKRGISGAFWYGGFGEYGSVRKLPTFATDTKTMGPDSPIVMTVKALYLKPGLPMAEQQNAGRAELISTSFREYERRVREQLTEMFASTGFDAKRDVAGIVLNRWGHAYCSPQPGFFFGKDGQPAPREILRRAPFGRIAFANTDLSGDPGHHTAVFEGQRAASQLVGRG